MADIRKYAVEETSVLHLRDSDEELMYDGQGDDKKPRTVTLYGPGSKVYAKANAARHNRQMDKFKSKGKSKQSAQEIADENAEFLTACTASMAQIEYDALQGESLYKAVYSDLSIGFIADQVSKYLGEWGNFTKASTKN